MSARASGDTPRRPGPGRGRRDGRPPGTAPRAVLSRPPPPCRSRCAPAGASGGSTVNIEYLALGTIALLILAYLLVALLRPERF